MAKTEDLTAEIAEQKALIEALKVFDSGVIDASKRIELIGMIERYVDRHPDESELHRDLAKLYLAQGNVERAKDAVLRAWVFKPEDPETKDLMRRLI